ncbi:MAG: hypothetical protein M5T61_21560 [Acidimicrobiia bacterium]|nr:hypothetical protein [Acidimicrobiia bacterium]
MADELRAEGIEVNAVIVADDENLDIAKAHRFDTIEMPNHLGARYNAGIHHAYQHGADYICPDGSDDWIHPDYLTNLPTDGTVRTARACWIIDETGHRIAHLKIGYDGGSRLPRLPPPDLRGPPAQPGPPHDRRAPGIDTSILTNLEAALGHPVRWQPTDDPDLIAEFKTRGHQLNSYRDCLLPASASRNTRNRTSGWKSSTPPPASDGSCATTGTHPAPAPHSGRSQPDADRPSVRRRRRPPLPHPPSHHTAPAATRAPQPARPYPTKPANVDTKQLAQGRNSPAWHALRKARLTIDGYQCADCLGPRDHRPPDPHASKADTTS